jgi:hypothetical protein
MPATLHKNQFMQAYCILFYVLMVYKWFNGMFLYQLSPFLFNTRADVVTWLWMQMGIHIQAIQNPLLYIWMDVLFYSMPFIWFLLSKKNTVLERTAAAIMLIVNFNYVQLYTLLPTNSIEGHLPWLILPVVLLFTGKNTFEWGLRFVRYALLFFFFSAGIWKLLLGGAFYTEQMSHILLVQHKEILVATPQHWYASFIQWLINHALFSFGIYWAAILLELSFVIGFFTRQYDRWLLGAVLLFLVCNHFLMRIPYYELTPLLLSLKIWPSEKHF